MNKPRLLTLTFFFYFFGVTGVWTWGFVLARQALYPLKPFLRYGLAFLPGLSWTLTFLFMLHTDTGIIGVYHHTEIFLLRPWSWWLCKLFCPGWLRMAILPISTSWLTRIAGMSQDAWLLKIFNKQFTWLFPKLIVSSQGKELCQSYLCCTSSWHQAGMWLQMS
jgi:hypothetical protein